MKRVIKHILVMSFITPWIGGTIIGYCAYWNTKVVDLPSAISYFFTAAMGVLLFGLLLTSFVNIPLSLISYMTFRLLSKASLTRLRKKIAIVAFTIIFTACFGFMVSDIASDIGTSFSQVVFAICFSAFIASLLNLLNWVPDDTETKTIQQVVAPDGE